MAALFNVVLRKATYHFRRGVPLDLRPQLRRRELVRSLATSDPRTAKLRACQLYVASEIRACYADYCVGRWQRADGATGDLTVLRMVCRDTCGADEIRPPVR